MEKLTVEDPPNPAVVYNPRVSREGIGGLSHPAAENSMVAAPGVFAQVSDASATRHPV